MCWDNRGEGTAMDLNGDYQYLKPKRGSRYRQLFCGRIRAEVLYRETVGREPLPPEEVAKQYDVPLEAVREAIDYCVKNKGLLDAERAREDAAIQDAGRDKWPYAPADGPAEE
jgi:hypothetical protein